MDEQQFHARLANVLRNISDLPEHQQETLCELAAKARDHQTRLHKTMGELQSSMDYLRLTVKYLVFDLEATRRENAYLRKLLDARDADTPDDEDGFETL